MNKIKFLVTILVLMFILSMTPTLIGEADDLENFTERKYKENRDIIPIYTKNGIEKAPNSRGKPGIHVIIDEPTDGSTVSGAVDIVIDSNDNPAISIDGTQVGTGLLYSWDTTIYSDGSHTIQASARGHTDTATVIVDNGGGGGNTAPTVTITNPNNGATITGTITITVDATDPEDGTLTADIYIDGVYQDTTNSYNWDTTTYTDSSHTIYAEATDSGSLSDSDQITITVNNGGGGGDIQKYALVIGISDYEGTANDLTYCDDDAQDWKNFLQSNGYSVDILIDQQATAQDIENALYDLLALEDSDDYVVLTYSGHGVKYRNYGSCIISQDLYYMSHGYFESFFDNADSPHIYFAFDACQIGGFKGLVENNRVGAFGSNTKYSYDGDNNMQNGVFTYYQMEGWGIYDNFEDDATYAIQGMQNWALQVGISVDPFLDDQFSGPMLP